MDRVAPAYPAGARRAALGVTRTAVLGTGSWGTAFGKVLADAGGDVVLWARRPELARALRERHENPDYLPGLVLPHRLTATSDAQEAVADADVVVLAVPSQQLRANLAAVRGALLSGFLALPGISGIWRLWRTSRFLSNLSVLLAQGVPLTEALKVLEDAVGADGRVFLISQDGTVSVVEAKGAWEVLAVSALDDEVFATPAIGDGRIYIRTASSLYAFGGS